MNDRVSAAVGLVAKAPVAGEVKTRLSPPLSPQECAEVAAALLADTAASALASGAAVVCVHAGPASSVADSLPAGIPLRRQRGDGLAQRLAAAQGDLHRQGYERVVLLGADCPTVEPDYLRAAMRALDEADVVLGPAVDGGYTLIGTTRPQPGLFDVRMSTPRVLRDTLARAADLGLFPRCLAPRHDLDTVADLARALRSGQLDHAPRTRALATRLTTLAS